MKETLFCIIICFNAHGVFAQQGVHSFPLVPPPATQGAGGMQDINSMVGGNSALSNADVQSLLNPAVFFQVLVTDSAKYSLYKLINTTFVAANFKNNGYFTTGSQNNQTRISMNIMLFSPVRKPLRKSNYESDPFVKFLVNQILS